MIAIYSLFSSFLAGKRSFSLSAILLFSNFICGQINIRNIGVKEGLSNSNIICIFQDSKQRMWFGTWNGLNRYDGDKITKWKVGFNDPSTISNSIIYQVGEGQEGQYWIATSQHLNRFDERTETFYKYPLINVRFAVSPGKLLVSYVLDKPGLKYYDASKDAFSSIILPLLQNEGIRNIGFDSKVMWVHTTRGALYKVPYQLNGNTLSVKNIEPVYPAGNIFLFSCFDDSGIWIIHNNGWLVFRDSQFGREVSYVNVLPDLNFLSQEFQDDTHLLIDKNNRVIHMNSKLGGINKYSFNETGVYKKEVLMKGQIITYLNNGPQNTLWVGTEGLGVFMLYENIFSFSNLPNELFGNSLRKTVRSFLLDKDSTLWVATKGGGIFLLPRFHISNTEYSLKTRNLTIADGLLNDQVYTLYKMKNDNILIGGEGSGINVYNPAKRLMSSITAGHPMIKDPGLKYIYAIAQDDNDNIWLGTERSGLVRLSLNSGPDNISVTGYKRFEKKQGLNSNSISCLLADGDADLWIGTKGGGLALFNTRNYKIRVFSPESKGAMLSSVDVICIYKDSRDNVWVGTFAGLNKLSTDGKGGFHWRVYTDKEGLPDNTVRAITEDSAGNIWLSTNSGLCRLNTAHDFIESFGTGSGLLQNEFADNAAYKSNDALFFGGNSGFSSFLAYQIKTYNFLSPLLFTEFKVHNEKILLSRYANKDGVLQLKYNQNFFSVAFNAIDYLQANKTEYLYQLEGFNEKWVDNGTSNVCYFTNVPPGDYTLKVRQKNIIPKAAGNVATLRIQIAKPWWKHPIAYCIYVLLAALAAWVAIRIFLTIAKEKRNMLIEKMNRKKEEEIHESKLTFFTNMAHELTTPLTLVNGPCDKILNEPGINKRTTDYVTTIKTNAMRMNGLLKQMMEFRKAETGHLSLFITPVNIPGTIESIMNDFRQVIEEKRITIDIEGNLEDVHFPTDKSCLEKILYNLISNSIKYTPNNGAISIDYRLDERRLVFEIINTGKGIRREDLPLVFDRFKVLDNEPSYASSGFSRNGIGLSLCASLVGLLKGEITADSEYGRSATFKVMLPGLPLDDESKIQSQHSIAHSRNYFEEVIKDDLELAVSQPAHQQIESANKKEAPLILIVEDSAEISSLLKDSFEKKYNLGFASNGVEAIEFIKTQIPDLIISDIMMPDMDGYELTRQVKNNKIISHVPVILLSGIADVDKQIKGLHSGADAYVSKPFDINYLETLTGQLLQNRTKLKQYYNSSASLVDYHVGKEVTKKDRDFLEQLNGIINAEVTNEALDTNYLCEKLHISRIQLYRNLKRLNGQSPADYIRRLRYAYSCKLLTTTEKTIQEIIYESGFANKASYYKGFSKIYNCSPAEYRAKRTY
ncbi:MAG: two-component regulator propeller domain-containing protein [Niabella sp.]